MKIVPVDMLLILCMKTHKAKVEPHRLYEREFVGTFITVYVYI